MNPPPHLDQLAAIVVTYHPDASVFENLNTLRPQVGQLIVVDNGSSPAELAALRSAATDLPFHLIENASNLGIATALNQGVRFALSQSFAWVLLFDQDSRVTPGFTSTLLHGFVSSPHAGRLGLLVPTYIDLRNGNTLFPHRTSAGTLAVAITSGSLIPAHVFAHHGFFLDDLFIDGVDHEFSLRLRRAGLILDELPAATLLHSPGEPRRFRLLGKPNFIANNYSPIRRYYQARNNLWIARHYFPVFPAFCLRLLADTFKELLKVLLAEDQKLRKLLFLARGLRDGLFGRMGKLSDP